MSTGKLCALAMEWNASKQMRAHSSRSAGSARRMVVSISPFLPRSVYLVLQLQELAEQVHHARFRLGEEMTLQLRILGGLRAADAEIALQPLHLHPDLRVG